MKEKPVIAITMGDPAGIGPEVIIKSLSLPEVRNICEPVIIGSAFSMLKTAESIKSDTPLMPLDSCKDIDFQVESIPILDCVSSSVEVMQLGHETALTGAAASQALKKAVELAMAGFVKAIVTGPTSKHALHLAGYSYPGQTEFLADLTGASEVVMMLVSENFRVALVTTHCSLSDVARLIKKDAIVKKLTILDAWLRKYFGFDDPRIAVCALNPHAGDGGIFGREEIEIIEPALKEAKRQGIHALGPLPADTLFAQIRVNAYDAYLAMYHDQGLIPLKRDAFGKGVNVTLGLPIIRTSPDHGTAFDIAGKGTADPGSMAEAIKLATHMATMNQ